MNWLQRHSWWALLAMALILVLFGVGDFVVGFEWDPGIPVGLTGMTPAQLRGESEQAYRLLDHGVRGGGVNLVAIGTLLSVVLFFGFRRGQLWAWWAMWVLPAWAASVFFVMLAFGVAPGQAPPPPMISGPIFASLAAALLLVSAPRFFGRGVR
ncbi:hypothetical protein BH18CHL2_BH18CHL2_10370 [soil metagenome]